MKYSLTLVTLGLIGQAVAFPRGAIEHLARMDDSNPAKRQAVTFNPSLQYISTTGEHAFVAPGQGDQRGPCPGLNALANHNYLPHDGIATIQQFIDGTNSVFGMGLDLSTFLAIYGAVLDGDLTSWSIGGSDSRVTLGGLLSQPQGISYSHNKYETDASPSRGDLYEDGNAWDVQLDLFKQMYDLQSSESDEDANYDLSVLTPFRAARNQQSIENNPYFFYAPFSGIAVQPAAYTFIYRFMANKSAEYPEGRLNKNVLKSFFAISGEDDSLQYNLGHERIPDNWYKRAIGDEYTIPYYLSDVVAAAIEYPQFASIGGNTGTVNSFTGLDPANLTNGVYNTQTLLEGDNLGCFAFQIAVQQAPDFLTGVVEDLTGAISTLTGALSNALAGLNCPTLESFDDSAFQAYPGYTKLNKQTGIY